MTKPKRTIFKVRMVYKSGYTHDFEAYKLNIERDLNGSLNSIDWEPVTAENRPVFIGINDVAAVWQIGVREE